MARARLRRAQVAAPAGRPPAALRARLCMRRTASRSACRSSSQTFCCRSSSRYGSKRSPGSRSHAARSAQLPVCLRLAPMRALTSLLPHSHCRRFGCVGILALACSCKEYASGLAREARRATALALPRRSFGVEIQRRGPVHAHIMECMPCGSLRAHDTGGHVCVRVSGLGLRCVRNATVSRLDYSLILHSKHEWYHGKPT